MHRTTMKFLLQRIRNFRKNAKLTQQDVAKQLGINQATYSAMERGSQRLFADYLPKIAKVLGIPIWQLFVDPEKRGELDEETKAFLKMWKLFDPSERNLLKAMAEQITQKKELEMLDPETGNDDDPPVEIIKYKKGHRSA